MDVVKIDKKLKRITTVYDSFKEDGKISSLEKDLLLGYIRELYEHISEIEAIPAKATKTLSELPMDVPNTVPSVSTSVNRVSEVTVEKAEDPVIVQDPVSEKKPTIENKVPQTLAKEETTPSHDSSTSKTSIPQELKKIFTIAKARDISERLSMSPISDIAKAMSINDKMLILKELFGNDTAVFNDSLTKLNAFTSFEEAKNYLIEHIAVKYQWAQEERMEKAEAFVKLVSRRYT